MTERCSVCSTPLTWITRDGEPALTCPRAACPGDRSTESRWRDAEAIVDGAGDLCFAHGRIRDEAGVCLLCGCADVEQPLVCNFPGCDELVDSSHHSARYCAREDHDRRTAARARERLAGPRVHRRRSPPPTTQREAA